MKIFCLHRIKMCLHVLLVELLKIRKVHKNMLTPTESYFKGEEHILILLMSYITFRDCYLLFPCLAKGKQVQSASQSFCKYQRCVFATVDIKGRLFQCFAALGVRGRRTWKALLRVSLKGAVAYLMVALLWPQGILLIKHLKWSFSLWEKGNTVLSQLHVLTALWHSVANDSGAFSVSSMSAHLSVRQELLRWNDAVVGGFTKWDTELWIMLPMYSDASRSGFVSAQVQTLQRCLPETFEYI